MNDIHDKETQRLHPCNVTYDVGIKLQSHQEYLQSQVKQNATLRATLFNFAVTLRATFFNFAETLRATLFILAAILLLPALLSAQLRELEITPDATPATIPVFTDHPDNAAVIINSSIPNLQFSSTLEIVQELSEPASGRYILIIPPFRQSISVSAPGYISQSFSVGAITAREVRYFRVEPRNINITETGTLIVRTNPSGATITLDGVPGTYTSPYTFTDLLAQGYTLRLRLNDHEDEAIQVGVNSDRPTIQSVDLIPTFGFLTVNTPDATLFLRDEGTDSEYRRSYTQGQALRLDVGRYNYRLTREGYADATGTFEIIPNEPASINPELSATFGFLRIDSDENITVVVTPVDGGSETRLASAANRQHQLPIGRYRYRAVRDFYQEESGTFEITSNAETRIAPRLSPDYGTLTVISNIPNFTLTARDNNAPGNPAPSAINLEQGRRTVVVSAPGYVDLELDVRMAPGEQLQRNITLETTTDQQARLRREELPRGVLEVSADVDAEIWVNGNLEGTGSVVLTLIPDRYDVQLRHAAGRQSFSVNVPSADIIERHVELRPARSRALSFATVLPGSGHLYRKDTRGYAYLALFAGSAVYTYTSFSGYQNNLSAYNEAQEAYLSNRSVTLAPNLRNAVLEHYAQVNDARDALLIAGGILAGVYTIQLLDVLITSPRYGYRGSGAPGSVSQRSNGIGPSTGVARSVGFSTRIDGHGLTTRISF